MLIKSINKSMILIAACKNKERKKRKSEIKNRKKKGKLLEAFGPGWGSEPSHDYAGSSLFNTDGKEIKYRFRIKRKRSKSPIRKSTSKPNYASRPTRDTLS